MGYVCLYLAVVAAGLLWSAACTAAAARTARGWLKALLAAIGVGLPVIAVLPVVAATWWLTSGMRSSGSLFPYAITMLLSLVTGGAWIVRAGLTPRDGGDPPTARWPIIGLTALCVIATAVTLGVVLILDNAVTAQAPYLRIEAADLMQKNFPPVSTDDENAAPLHSQIAAAIAADKSFYAAGSPLHAKDDVGRDDVTTFLGHHADTLALIRQAADLDTCRFTRGSSSPSFDTLLPEIQGLRIEARLLALAARRAAREGRHADALADIVRIHRLGRHAAQQAMMVSYLMGVALDHMALGELADLLPSLGADDGPLLDSVAVRECLGRRIDLMPALHGDEAFGLATFAGWADGCRMAAGDAAGADPARSAIESFDVGPIFRVVFLHDEIEGYKTLMHASQQLAERLDTPPQQAAVPMKAGALEAMLHARAPGIFSRLLVPSLAASLRMRIRDEAAHRAASVLVVATQQRLRTASLPLSPPEFTGSPPFAMPDDPFAAEARSLAMLRTDDGIAVYSVGPNGEDDGGPTSPREDADAENDDVGFVMAIDHLHQASK